MNCVETKNNIEALLDGELDDAQKDAIEHHLWICPPCLELKERMSSFSSFLRTSEMHAPPSSLDDRVMKSFAARRAPKKSLRSVVFGAIAVPKPIFAAFTIAALAAFWLAFQVGKITSTNVSISAPVFESREISASPIENKIENKNETVTVEIPVIKEKIVTRIVYVREPQDAKNTKNAESVSSGKEKTSAAEQGVKPQFVSTVAENGFYTDVSLKGFEPSAEISAKIIKEVKENEK